jgi:hypothetical protein
MCGYGLLAARLNGQTFEYQCSFCNIVNMQAKGHAACQTTEGRKSWGANVREVNTCLIKGTHRKHQDFVY